MSRLGAVIFSICLTNQDSRFCQNFSKYKTENNFKIKKSVLYIHVIITIKYEKFLDR
jgi:hypothetical protein